MRAPTSPADRLRSTLTDSGYIESCSQCHAFLGLAAPTVTTPAKSWLCGRCGSAYLAVVADQELWAVRASSARPVVYDQVIAAATTSRPSRREKVPHRDLQRVLQYLQTLDHPGPEKRRERRHAVALPVMALPLAKNFRVSGPAVELTTINISKGGASFIENRLSDAAYIAIDFSYAGLGFIQALLEVLRVRPFMSAYEIAGKWHCRVNPFNFPQPPAAHPFG